MGWDCVSGSGLGRTEPGWAVRNGMEVGQYNLPTSSDIYGMWDDTDDVDSELKRAYIFYKFDGHV